MMAEGRNLTDSEALGRVLKDRQLGPAAKLAFLVLWWRAGGWVDEIVITPAWLGAQLGCDRKTAWGWLETLRNNDLIDIVRRNRRTGELQIQVRNPCPGDREAIPDPQQRLPLAHAREDTDQDGQPPDPSHGGSAEAEKARGGLPLQTPARAAAEMPGPCQETARGDLGAQTPATQAHATSQVGASGEGRAGVYDAKPPSDGRKPPRLFGTKEKEFILPKCQRTKEFKAPKNQSTKIHSLALGSSIAGVYDAKPPRAEDGPLLGGSVFGEAAAGVMIATEPQTQKRRLMQRIQAACGGSVASWVLGSAANLVVYYGIPIEDLDLILGDVSAMREAGGLRDAGAFFHSKARELAGRYGARWPRRGSEAAP
jgi:hypothetical protein